MAAGRAIWKAVPVVDASKRALRQAAVDRLAQLAAQNGLSSDQVRLTAGTLGVTERTVWRWLAARKAETPERQRDRFRIDDRLRVRLAYWRGNAAALQRELVAQHRAGGPPAPTVSIVQRAILRDLTPGEIAGLRRGERERRKFDVFLQRLWRTLRLPAEMSPADSHFDVSAPLGTSAGHVDTESTITPRTGPWC